MTDLEALVAVVGALGGVSGLVVLARARARRIYYVGNLSGNYVRFKPNFGFNIAGFKWSRKYGRNR